MALNGITPVQASRIEMEPDWHELITSATIHTTQTELAYKNNCCEQNNVEQPIPAVVRT